jgi:ABC-type uncharacterized transport system ATPase subunit
MLTVEHVHRRFARVHAVNDISFHVDAGEIFALLGPNGAGKSTLLRMLVGITRPDSGRIVWRSGNATASRLSAEEIGYLPEDRGLYQDQPLIAVLEYFGTIEITLTGATPVGALLTHCAAHVTIVDVRTEQPSLHEVYINTVGAVTAPAPTEVAA